MRHLEHRHGAVEQTVHDLEPGRLVAPQRRGMPLVARLALARGVLEHDVGRIEDAQRQRVRPVLPDRLEQAWQQRRAHHLELERLGVRDLDRRLAVVGRVQPSKVFFVGALRCDAMRCEDRSLGGAGARRREGGITYENEWQNLDPAGVRPFVPDDVAELANSQRLRYCARRWEYIWQIVEPVGDRRVFHDVAFMQNVRPRWRDRHDERICVPR